jgi:hypothetical protein
MSYEDLPGPAASLDARRDTLDHRENLRRSPNHPRAVAFWRSSVNWRAWLMLAICFACAMWCYWMAGMPRISR